MIMTQDGIIKDWRISEGDIHVPHYQMAQDMTIQVSMKKLILIEKFQLKH